MCESSSTKWENFNNIVSVALEKCKKSALKHFTEKPILLNSKNLPTIFFPGL